MASGETARRINGKHQNTQPDSDLAGPEPVEPSPGSKANGADPVVAFVAANLVGRAADAQVPAATRPAAKRRAEEQAGPASAKHHKPNSCGFEILENVDGASVDSILSVFGQLDHSTKHSDFITAQGKLCEYYGTAKNFLRYLEVSPDSEDYMKEYYAAVNGFNRNKKIMLLYREEHGFPEETTEYTKLLLKKEFDLLF